MTEKIQMAGYKVKYGNFGKHPNKWLSVCGFDLSVTECITFKKVLGMSHLTGREDPFRQIVLYLR